MNQDKPPSIVLLISKVFVINILSYIPNYDLGF